MACGKDWEGHDFSRAEKEPSNAASAAEVGSSSCIRLRQLTSGAKAQTISRLNGTTEVVAFPVVPVAIVPFPSKHGSTSIKALLVAPPFRPQQFLAQRSQFGGRTVFLFPLPWIAGKSEALRR